MTDPFAPKFYSSKQKKKRSEFPWRAKFRYVWTLLELGSIHYFLKTSSSQNIENEFSFSSTHERIITMNKFLKSNSGCSGLCHINFVTLQNEKRGEIPELRIFSMHWYYAVNFSFYLTWLRYDVYSLHKCSFYGKDTTYLNIVTQLNKLEFQ